MITALLLGLAVPALVARAQGRSARDEAVAQYFATQVDIEDMVRIPMRDGIRLNSMFVFPKGKPRQNLPTILIFFPYQIRPANAENQRFLENGYVIAYVNARGRYFSEGVYTYMGGSGLDGYDTIDWISKQPWSNGKVGAIGCSSSAEEQNKMNAMQHPAFAAAIPRSAGAGIGKMGPYYEMGNHLRGGIFQNLWLSWYHGSGFKYTPAFPPGLSREQMLRIRKTWDLQPEHIPPVNFDTVVWTLPIYDIMKKIGSAPSDLDEFMTWPANDPRWKTLDYGNEGDRNGAPALYINAWYDVSTGPNLAMFEYQSKNAANQTARDNTLMVVAPTAHCQQASATEHTVVGERDMGDARFDYAGLYLRWFDHWLKGVDNDVTKEPKARVYMMGSNEWRTYSAWPPPEAKPVTYYLDSDGNAATLNGNGRLTTTKPKKNGQDNYAYDPLNPTPSVGGQVCCFNAANPGSFNQQQVESRPDVLVYTSDVLTANTEVTGSIPVSLYLSSDVKDTDLIATLVDVYPDGRAFNLDQQALRVRYREGYDKQVFMQPGNVYKVDLPPLVTSNAFLKGHRIRLAITSSSFPVLERNLNTGGKNYNEKDPVTAHNAIHHAPAYLSSITLPILPAKVVP
ncbi:MAG: CocE/NonD family hydrolase [Gemmatimonadaceae bacterium]